MHGKGLGSVVPPCQIHEVWGKNWLDSQVTLSLLQLDNIQYYICQYPYVKHNCSLHIVTVRSRQITLKTMGFL
ncbi:hypothetical protein RchiOBHm_Chr5g0028091 [Rosa chinensis]|uniref:Uncharacterized protein n=1 Tax=Rosa chinensis TaxID=74649 RepID=A0A2P6Q996_ROSCH|nr:hypothetical protein RchiOBHm_Chr5g0028091 [Rosa chinensis]